MATKELTLSYAQAANLLVVLNAVERLPLLSAGLIEGVDEGKAYEVLCRQLRVLHHNLVEVSDLATAAKISKKNHKEAA